MLKPNFKITRKKKKSNVAQFILSPLEPGYGHTLGNALRRTLLASLPGAAITQIKIKGIHHQFTTLTGLKEDIVEFCLNLKQVRLKVKAGKGPFKATLDVKGPGEIKAADIKTSAEVEVVNPDLVLGHLADKKARFKAEMQLEKGFGYRLAEKENRKIDVILLDATFTPILQVAYQVKATRVGRRTDLDELTLTLETDGTIDPKMALEESAKILAANFKHVYQPVFEKKKKEKEKGIVDETRRLSVEEIGLPTRIANALVKGGFKTVGSLLKVDKGDILKIKNFGEKSLTILDKKLKKKGV